MMAINLVESGYVLYGSTAFWIAHAAVANLYITTFALAFFAAASRITFASENRSTSLRIIMLTQQASAIGWAAWAWIDTVFAETAVFGLAFVAGLYWFVMGAMMNGEAADMSRRVKRSLPQSLVGRVFLTWLSPGSGTGFMFTVANLTTIALLGLAALAVRSSSGNATARGIGTQECVYFICIGWAYTAAYLGLGRIVVAVLRRWTLVTMMACVLLHILLVLAGIGIPTIIQWMSVPSPQADYSLLQITNPLWSLSHVIGGSSAAERFVLLIVVMSAAVCLLLVNMPSVIRELQQVRSLPPPRVLADEAELHPEPAAKPRNPWE
jgi:hypothetical protein